MTVDLSALNAAHRVLFEIPLEPVQSPRFQPTGFPNLGAATFKSPKGGECLLVESPQSMANRLELTTWSEENKDLKPSLSGLSHVRVRRNGSFFTDSLLESHRLNSPYVLDAVDTNGQTFFDSLYETFRTFDEFGVDRQVFARELLRLDAGSLIHGVFLSQPRKKKSLAGGRLRVTRALSAFIEARGVQTAPHGGSQVDRINPSWPKAKSDQGYGNKIYARDHFTAEKITLFASLDLAQIRGYGLGDNACSLLQWLALYKLRALVDDFPRLRTECLFAVNTDTVTSTSPAGFALPALTEIETSLRDAIGACADEMVVTDLDFTDKILKGKAEGEGESSETEPDEIPEE